MPRPQQGLQPGWNQVEVLLDAEIIRAFLNDGGGEASAAAENMDEYGPMALYVGAASELRFKDVAWKNIAIKLQPDEIVGAGFRMQRINEFFYGWSAAAADFNHDGKLDIVSDPFIYYGPDFRHSSEIYPNEAYNTSTQYPAKDWIERAADFNHDGWPDVLTSGRGVGADLYINPHGELSGDRGLRTALEPETSIRTAALISSMPKDGGSSPPPVLTVGHGSSTLCRLGDGLAPPRADATWPCMTSMGMDCPTW